MQQSFINDSHSYMHHSKKLLNQCLNAQLWALGRDIHHHSGNLLIKYGMRKQECPPEVKGSHKYMISPGAVQINIWAFGVCIVEPGQSGIIVKRFTGIPRIINEDKSFDIWSPDAFLNGTKPLPPKKATDAQPLLHQLADFFIHYEMWVESILCKNYRRQILRQNKKLKIKSKIGNYWERFKDSMPLEKQM